MPRPKKVAKKAPVKRTRRAAIPGGPTDTVPFTPPIPVSQYPDQLLRKECLAIAANNGSSISTLVEDAHKLYDFVTGKSAGNMPVEMPAKVSDYQFGQKDPVKLANFNVPPLEPVYKGEAVPEIPARSKFDAHTL